MAVRKSRSTARPGLLCALVAGGALVAGAATAEAPERATATLEYEVAANATGCPTREELVDAVAARLGYVPFVPSSPNKVRVTVVLAKNRYAGTVRMGGSRSLDSSDCRELVDSLAVAVALGLDPESASRPPPSTSSASAPPPPPASASAVPPAASSAPVAPAPPPKEASVPEFVRTVRLSGGPFGSFGDTPSPTLGLALGVEVALAERFAIEAELSGTLPSSVRIGTGGRGTASALAARALLGLCVPVAPLSFCATGSGGMVYAEASDVDVPRTDLSPSSTLGLRASVRVPLSERLFLRAVLDGQVPLSRVDLRIDGASLWETAPVVGRLGLAFGARL